MEKLIEKVENLKNVLDEQEKIKQIKNSNVKVLEDEELLKLIKDYNQTKNPSIKEKILRNKNFQDYKEQETEINFIILEINQKLKEISKRGNCNL